MRVKFGIDHAGMHVDQLLSNVAIGYMPEGIIADAVMPIVTVPKQSDNYLIFDRGDVLRIESTRRSPGTEANKITRNVSSATFFCENFALKYPVTIEDKANADPIFVQGILNSRVNFIQDKLYLDWENRVASLVTNTSNVGSSSAVNSAWTDYTSGNADPINDINTAIDNVQDQTGKRPNKIIFGQEAWRHFRRNEAVRNLIYGTNNGGGFASRDQVKSLFEVDELLVGGAYKNTGNEAQADALSQIWGDKVLVSYTAPNPSIEIPSFAYSFRWKASGLPDMMVERHPYDSKIKAEEIEVGYYQDEIVTGADYGFLIVAVTSAT